MTKHLFRISAACLCFLLSRSNAADFSAPPAEHLPKAGLCGIIGDGGFSPWVKDLVKGGNVVVHCIAPDDAAAEAMARTVGAAGLGGKIVVESIPVTPIPWRVDLLNCLVIEKPDGVDLKRALESVAPGGALCVFQDGEWNVTTRERPKGMDEWTHNYRNPGGNSGVSDDQLVGFPLGLRWHDDLPFNLSTSTENSNAWTNTRALAVVDGRVYYVTNCARENLRRTASEMRAGKETQDQYLIARDAWNGTLLWRKKLGDMFYGNLFFTARAPMVATGGKVYAVTKEKEILELDGLTGETCRVFKTQFMPSELTILDGMLVAVCWEGGERVGVATGINRWPLDVDVEKGAVVAFDLATGRQAWEQARLATSLRAANGRVYLVERKGADNFEIQSYLRARRRGQFTDYDPNQPEKMKEKYGELPGRGEQKVVALDVRKGTVLWDLAGSALDLKPIDHIAVGVAGLNDVVVTKNTHAITRSGDREAICLEGESGRVVFRRKTSSFPVLYEGNIHIDGIAFDPLTGSNQEGEGIRVGVTVCTPQIFVNGITTNNRSASYKIGGETHTFGAARGSCMFAAVPANGAFYTPQTFCACAPGTVPGFISFGPIGDEPSGEELAGGAALIRGPAYGKQEVFKEGAGAGWSTYLGNGDRSCSNLDATAPGEKLAVAWRKEIAKPIGEGNIESSWKDSLEGLLTAPVASGGLVIAADRHRHKLVALRSVDGSVAWERIIGGRITAPPTLTDGLCLLGANDGYVYALDARDGALAWKLRMGTEDRRMVAYAQPESPWPVFSGILLSEDGAAYASAGRSTGAEGGIIVRAFAPKTGKVLWSTPIAYRQGSRAEHVNDVMYLYNGRIHLMKSMLDPATGEIVANPYEEHVNAIKKWQKARAEMIKAGEEVPPQPSEPTGLGMYNLGIEGLANANWTRLGDRRRRLTIFEKVEGDLIGWNDSMIVASAPGRTGAYRRTKSTPDGKPGQIWSASFDQEQVTAMALGKNAVVFGGGRYPDDGRSLGFVRVVNRESGKPLGELEFPAPLSFHGLGLADGVIYATFEDGQMVAIGGAP